MKALYQNTLTNQSINPATYTITAGSYTATFAEPTQIQVSLAASNLLGGGFTYWCEVWVDDAIVYEDYWVDLVRTAKTWFVPPINLSAGAHTINVYLGGNSAGEPEAINLKAYIQDTESGKLDASISTRLATTSYTAPDNAGINAALSAISGVQSVAQDAADKAEAARIAASRRAYTQD